MSCNMPSFPLCVSRDITVIKKFLSTGYYPYHKGKEINFVWSQ